MIDRLATIKKFGYDPATLSKGSGKRVVAVCDGCGKVRDMAKQHYGDLCPSCAQKKRFKNPKEREKTGKANKKRFKNPAKRKKLVPLCKHCHATAHNDTIIARLGYMVRKEYTHQRLQTYRNIN